MKKVLLLTIVSLSIAFISNAQIVKGSKLLGVDFGAGYNKSASNVEESKQSSFYANPSLGFTTKENTVFGVQVLYGHGKSKYYSNPTQESNAYGGGIFVRRYLQLGKHTYLFGQADAGYEYNKSEQSTTNYSSISKGNSISLSAYPGFSFAVSKRLLVEAGLNKLLAIGYGHSNQEINMSGSVSKSEYSSFSASSVLGGNTSFKLGFRFLCSK